MWISRDRYDDLRMALGGQSQRADFYKAMYEGEVEKRKELQTQLAKVLKGDGPLHAINCTGSKLVHAPLILNGTVQLKFKD